MFDIVFEVEGMCHATNMKFALAEAYRVLKPGGKFIIFDGFRTPNFNRSSRDLQTAARLVEIAMSVENFWVIDDYINSTSAIIPNLQRLQKFAQIYFRFPFLAKIATKFLPPLLLKNAIAGLLMPFTVQEKVHAYYMILLERPQ